ncbi:hypothetical protein AMJ87_09340 [candidate division WOR_3 bacterium SM23_60]|uniref:Nucleotide pyrophosphatase n=1 Tax=candidate division WOR_3 bacterium SM23_60 TaxID=1703780 RepID=A0A0S8GAG7_UNCW3|nr:MAG: hypothetical protein AMJ87_09340 [candidate division WOR_3 bacterium SM23_60]
MKTFVLGLDGVPFSFLQKQFEQGKMPHFAKLAQENGFQQMNSVYPTVSSVAWTSYATGVNPGEHGIFGFVDRVANPFSITIPTARNRKAETLWHRLSQKNKRVIVINVPLTYPPEPVNGILISGFLCTDINDVAYPQAMSNYLKSKDYVIDVDAWLARESKQGFINKLHQALEKRFEIAFELMERETWDFFQLHVMETDRLLHFFWGDIEAHGAFAGETEAFFTRLDHHINMLVSKLSGQDRLLILSDHGFCGIKAEVQLNTWLEQQGLLKFTGNEKKLNKYHKDTVCYSLIPGRMYVNLKGREEKGTVLENDHDKVRADIKQRLLALVDPETNERVVDKVYMREEIYRGPLLEHAADLIAHPKNGYDLKAGTRNGIFVRTALDGMHTFDDAFICGVNMDTSGLESIQAVAERIT